MRLFVSIDFPQEVIVSISLLQKQLIRQELFEGKLIKLEQLHLTLQFIGEVEQERISLLQDALRTIAMPAFKVCLGPLGVLPSQDHIRIIWMDLKGKSLQELAQKVHEVLDPIVKLEERPFLSHVTIARVKKVEDREKFFSYLKSVEIEPICFSVNEFILKQSMLSEQGPEYTAIERYQLK